MRTTNVLLADGAPGHGSAEATGMSIDWSQVDPTIVAEALIDRLRFLQTSTHKSRKIALALTHTEEAYLWLRYCK